MVTRSQKQYLTKESHIKTLLRNVKHRAKTTGVEFNISFEYIKPLCVDVCPVFKKEILWGPKRIKNSYNSPSIDRINPQKGYVEGNVQIISNRANTLKYNASVDEIRQLLAFMENL